MEEVVMSDHVQGKYTDSFNYLAFLICKTFQY